MENVKSKITIFMSKQNFLSRQPLSDAVVNNTVSEFIQCVSGRSFILLIATMLFSGYCNANDLSTPEHISFQGNNFYQPGDLGALARIGDYLGPIPVLGNTSAEGPTVVADNDEESLKILVLYDGPKGGNPVLFNLRQ